MDPGVSVCFGLGLGVPHQASTLRISCSPESTVLDHHARYTEADVIPCSGEEPGEAKEREALRGAVLKQVWAEAWVGGQRGGRPGALQSCLPLGLTLAPYCPLL